MRKNKEIATAKRKAKEEREDEKEEKEEREDEDYGGYDGGSGYGNNMAEASATDKGELRLAYLEFSMMLTFVEMRCSAMHIVYSLQL